MSLELTKHEMDAAKHTAWRIGSKWSAVEVEDLQSHLTLWMLKHYPKLVHWREESRGKGALYVTLKREALRYCTRETAARQGQPIERNVFYNVEMLERALPFVFEAWPETTVRQDPNSGKPLDRPVDSGNALAIMADISGAFYSLPKDMIEVLEYRFRDGLTLAEIAELKDVTVEGARHIIARALKRLSMSLSGDD